MVGPNAIAVNQRFAQRLEELDAQVVLVRRKAISGTGLKGRDHVEAHSNGRAVVKQCHKELAELYKKRLQGED